jgi:hypothetical protein
MRMIQGQYVIEDFGNGQYKIFKRLWTRLAKSVDGCLVGIPWRGNHDSICKGTFSGKWLVEIQSYN